MAGVTLDKLPPALGLNGQELFWIYQQGPTEATPWIGLRLSLWQLSQWVANPQVMFGCTMRQLAAALASQSLLVPVLESLPGDVNDQYNIAWAHATTMTISDPFSAGFLQPTLGYSYSEMQALYADALTFPA